MDDENIHNWPAWLSGSFLRIAFLTRVNACVFVDSLSENCTCAEDGELARVFVNVHCALDQRKFSIVSLRPL